MLLPCHSKSTLCITFEKTLLSIDIAISQKLLFFTVSFVKCSYLKVFCLLYVVEGKLLWKCHNNVIYRNLCPGELSGDVIRKNAKECSGNCYNRRSVISGLWNISKKQKILRIDQGKVADVLLQQLLNISDINSPLEQKFVLFSCKGLWAFMWSLLATRWWMPSRTVQNSIHLVFSSGRKKNCTVCYW